MHDVPLLCKLDSILHNVFNVILLEASNEHFYFPTHIPYKVFYL